MILNGKAKEEFEKWILNTPQGHESQRMIKIYNQKELFVSYVGIGKTFLNTLIIEWLDSVGVYVTILVCIDLKFDAYVTIKEKRIEASQFNETRQQATEKAITKAVEIFNNLNK